MDETSPGTDAAKSSDDDLLDKFQKMQAYLPVLEIMINMLKNRSDKPRQAQLEKIRYVKKLIVERKWTTADSLRKCESLLRNYWTKFEDQLDKIPDIVFESNEGTVLSVKTDSSIPCESSQDSSQRIGQNCTQLKKEDEKVVSPLNSPKILESRHDSVNTRTAVSESRRKNRNPVQKFVHNDSSVDRSKSPTERTARRSSSLSPVHEKISSKKTDVWPHTRKDVGSSKYIDSDWRELDRHNSKESHSNNFDLHKSRQKNYNIVNNGGHSTKYTESREVASPKYISPDRKSSGGRKSDFSETSRFPEHLELNRKHLHNSRYNSSKSNAKKEAACEKEPIKNYLHKDESDKKLDHNVSGAKKSSDNTSIQVLPLDGNCVNDRPECVSDTHVNSKSISSDDSSCNSSANILGKMTEEELKKLVTENLSSLPTLPPETKCILETIKQCSIKQGSDEVVSFTEINPGARSDFESAHPPNIDNCQKIFQPSSRDPRRHSKDGQIENIGRCGLFPTPVENANHLSVQSHHSNNDIVINQHNFIPVITQMENFSNRQGYLSHTGQVDNIINVQPLLPITSPIEQRNALTSHAQQLENVGSGVDYLLPKSPVENMGNSTRLPLPVPQFNNVGNKLSPRDPRRCIQDSIAIVPDGPHQIPNVCVQPSVFQGDCRTQSAPMLNIQPLLPEPILNRIDYCHGIQPPIPYQPDMAHSVRSFSGSNSNVHMPMNTQHQVFRPSYTGLPAPRSMELSGYGRPNLQTIVPSTPSVFNNRPSGVPKIQAPVSNRPTSTSILNNQEGGQNARKKVFNSWLAIDPRSSSKLPSQMAGRSKYSQNSCKFQRPLNNSFLNSQQKGGEKSSTFDKRKQDEQKDSNTTKSSTYNSKRSSEGEKDSSKRKTDTHSRQKSGSISNAPTPSKSLFGAVIVSKDGKGKDIPTKFRIPKIKKPENSDVSVANESKNSCDESEDDVVHQMQLLFEKSLESDEVKKKIVEAIRSTLGMELKEKNSDPNKERLNSVAKVKDAIISKKSENKELCKKVTKSTKTTERRIKKYISSSSDEEKNEISVLEGISIEKTAASEQMSRKKNEQKKRPMVMSSDSSCDEKTEKYSATKMANSAEGRKTSTKILRNKSGNVDITKTTETIIVNAGKEESQGSCSEKCEGDANENLEDAFNNVTVDVEGGKKLAKRIRCESESSLVNEKLNDNTVEVGNVSTSKRTKRSEDSLKNTNDNVSEETKLNSVTNIDIQKLSKEKDKQKKRASDVVEINNSEDSAAKKRRKSQIETQACNKQSEVVSNLPQKVPKKNTERKRIKEVVLNATDSSDDGQNVADNGTNEREQSLKAAKSRKNATRKGSSGSSAEESYDSTYSSKTCEKENLRVSRNSLGDSGELVEKISLKKLRKKRLLRKKSKVITDDSSEEEESLDLKDSKCRIKNKKNENHDSLAEVVSEKSGSKLKRRKKERDTEESDESSLIRKNKQTLRAKANKPISLIKDNSDMIDDSSCNEMSENSRATRDSLSKRLKGSRLADSDVGNFDGEVDESRSGITKVKSKKHVIVSESDDSIDYNFSDKCKKSDVSCNKNVKENEMSKFIESCETFSKNKDPKQNRKSAKRRNALEMLQDDIREMFIGNEVALAFGQRKCTVKSQSDRKSEDAGRKKHVNRTDARKSVSVVNSSEESDSDDESEKIKLLKCEKKLLKTKVSTGRDLQCQKDVHSCKNFRFLARRPCKGIFQEMEFLRENFADSFYFCKKKSKISKNSRIKLQDVLGKLWSRVFKLGMNLQMGSDAMKAEDSEEKTNKLESNVSHVKEFENKSELNGSGNKSQNKSDVMDCENKLEMKESTVLSFSNSAPTSAEVEVVTIENKVNTNVENLTGLQEELLPMEVLNEHSNFHTANEIENNCIKAPTEEKENEPVGHELTQDNLVKQTNQAVEPVELKNVCGSEETLDENSCVTSNVDECDDTVSNLSVCDSDVSEKGSEISLAEAERPVDKRKAPRKNNLGKMTRGKRKKKISSWQNGVIKKSTKTKQNKHSNELPSVFQDHPIASPPLIKEKLLDERTICGGDYADPSYAIDGRAKYDCKFCNFSGVKIVPHYKTMHPDKEVCVSRLSSAAAEKAKGEAKNDIGGEPHEETENSSVRRQKRTFVCRICHQFSEYIYDFYCHITTHTGEYDYKCDSCSYSSSNISGVKHHILLHHNEFSRTVNLKRGPPHTAKVLYGYLCSVCNFIQVLKENVETHITLRHQKDIDAQILRINMSIPLEEQVTTEIRGSSNAAGSICGQMGSNEICRESTEGTGDDSAIVDHTNVEENTSGSRPKRISSKNVPASMNPVVVLKGMKHLIEKGTSNSGSKASMLTTEQNAGTENEGNLHMEESDVEEANLAENIGETEVFQNRTANVQKPLPSEGTVGHVTEEIQADGIDLNADSAAIINENSNVQSFCPARVESCVDKVMGTTHFETEHTHIPSDTAENQVTQKEINVSSHAVESHALPDRSVSTRDVERVATSVTEVVSIGVANEEAVGKLLDTDLHSSEETGEKSPGRSDTGTYKRSSLLERIEFLCSKSNASERHVDAATVSKHSKTDGKTKKNVAEYAERSTITTRAATIARKQVCSVESGDVNRVAVENDGALIGYSSVPSPLSLPGLESVVSERNNILRDNLKDIGSDSPTTDSSDSLTGPATVNLADHNYIKVVSTSSGMGTVTVKQENLDQEDSGTVGSNINRLELYDVTSMPDPTITSICIGPMEARREGERILFCCRISGCNFQCPQAVKFACHYNNEHEKEWDGFCFLCGEVIDGIRPFCLEQAVEHLLTFHLTSKLKQKNRINRNNIKTRSPVSTGQKTNKVNNNNSFIDSPSTTIVTTTCTVTPSTFVTTSVITCTSSSVTSNVAAVSETRNGGASANTSENCNSLAETRAEADLLKNVVVIKNEPCDAELDNRNSENQELARDPPAVCSSASVQDERPRIRVRRISGDRLSLRTEETREPPVSPIVNQIEVRTKVERTDAEDTEQFAALDKDVSNGVSLSAPAVLWPELSRAVCDESVLENSAGHCSPVLWGADTGGDASDAFSSIRIESVVSLNPEANVQDTIDVVGDADAGGHQSPSSPATMKKTYSRLQIDARSIAISSVPTASNIVRPKPPLAQSVKTPMKRMSAPLKLKVLQQLPEPECAASGLSKPVPRSPSRVAVIKPLSKEVLPKDASPGVCEKRAATALPQNKMQNTLRLVKNSKSPEAYRTMLETAKLQRLFKCMHSTCVFATSFEDRFVTHIKAHERLAGPGSKTKQQDFNRCAYCCKACQSVKDLVDHVLVEHGFCVYQCAYCFFRAMSPTYVLLHQRSSHVREAVAIIIDQRRQKMPELKDFPDKRENRRTVVLPYICAQGACGMRFYQCDDFLMHLKREHSQLTIYSCHLCECKNIKPDALLSHYKWHCLYQYQCIYCLHGADSAVDMKHHLCTFHSDQPNKAVIRIFQDNEHQSHRLVEDLLTIDLDEGMDYSNLFVQCVDDENELDNFDLQLTSPQLGHLSPATSDSSLTLDGDDPPTPAPPVVQAPSKPGPKPKGNLPVIVGLEGHDLFHCGNKGCIHTSATSVELKDHLSMCDFARESSMMECTHCKKKFKTTTSLVDHLLSHGAERFCCSNCGFKSTMRVVVEKHCRQVHKFPAMRMDPVYTGEVNMDTMWYVIRPREKRKVVKAAKVPEKKSYEPRDIHKLPDKDIFKEPVACSMCSFTTKVRVNMVRHLEMHEAEKRSAGSTVPSSCPVNPVPCLNRSEMMFDKMENLAASSQAMQAARLGADNQPVFVPERFRYVCGVADCRYMGCDEDMLRKHVFTLHTGEASYLCAHCKERVVIDAEMANVLEHLRMHGGKLFRCTYCSFFHYNVAQVEKHAAAKHPNQPIVPITIRRVVD